MYLFLSIDVCGIVTENRKELNRSTKDKILLGLEKIKIIKEVQ